MQGKAERVSDLRPLLQELYRDKLAALLRHEAAAKLVGDYDANNAYQYIINREETQLSWLSAAIAALGGEAGTEPPDGSTRESSVDRAVEPQRQASARGAAARAILEEDVRDLQAFVERWRPQAEALTNARFRGTLRVILGETIEQKRMFEQALAGRTDLLGRHHEPAGPSVGEVLPTRWIE